MKQLRVLSVAVKGHPLSCNTCQICKWHRNRNVINGDVLQHGYTGHLINADYTGLYEPVSSCKRAEFNELQNRVLEAAVTHLGEYSHPDA